MNKSELKIELFGSTPKPGPLGSFDFTAGDYSIELSGEVKRPGMKKKFMAFVNHNLFFQFGDGQEAKTQYPCLELKEALFAFLLNKIIKSCGIQEGGIVWIKGFPVSALIQKPKFKWERYRVLSLNGKKIKSIKGRRAEHPMLLKIGK